MCDNIVNVFFIREKFRGGKLDGVKSLQSNHKFILTFLKSANYRCFYEILMG
jgi:hypothetical protein